MSIHRGVPSFPVRRWGVPSFLGRRWGYHSSQPGGVTFHSWRGYPVPAGGWVGGTLSQLGGRGTLCQLEGGTLSQLGGTYLGWDRVPPPEGTGYPPLPGPAQSVVAMRRAVFLLRLRRRTSLLAGKLSPFHKLLPCAYLAVSFPRLFVQFLSVHVTGAICYNDSDIWRIRSVSGRWSEHYICRESTEWKSMCHWWIYKRNISNQHSFQRVKTIFKS